MFLLKYLYQLELCIKSTRHCPADTPFESRATQLYSSPTLDNEPGSVLASHRNCFHAISSICKYEGCIPYLGKKWSFFCLI